MHHEVNEVAVPDIEIVVRVGERELALVGIFKIDATTWDAVVGVDEVENRHAICTALQLALDAVSSANFSSIRTVGGDAGEPPPF